MTDKTATQNLTRTQASDDPRQVAAYLKTLATEADQRMAAHYRDLARSQNPPFAMLRVGTPFVLDGSNVVTRLVPFDTVAIDTAGLTDLSVDPHVITLTETGYWMVGGYAWTSGFNGNNDTYVRISAGNNNVADFRHDAAIGFVGASASAEMPNVSTNGSNVTMIVSWIGSSSTPLTQIVYAELWAFKVRDL